MASPFTSEETAELWRLWKSGETAGRGCSSAGEMHDTQPAPELTGGFRRRPSGIEISDR